MRLILLLITSSFSLFFLSCEKDFIEDEDCITESPGSPVEGWDNDKDTTIHQKPDSINGGFDISVDEWNDTLEYTYIIK